MPELTLLAYISRVLLYLSILGGLALLTFWAVGLLSAIQTAFVDKRGRETDSAAHEGVSRE